MGDDTGHPHSLGIDRGQPIGCHHTEFVEARAHELRGVSGWRDSGGPEVGDGFVDGLQSGKPRRMGCRENTFETIRA